MWPAHTAQSLYPSPPQCIDLCQALRPTSPSTPNRPDTRWARKSPRAGTGWNLSENDHRLLPVTYNPLQCLPAPTMYLTPCTHHILEHAHPFPENPTPALVPPVHRQGCWKVRSQWAALPTSPLGVHSSLLPQPTASRANEKPADIGLPCLGQGTAPSLPVTVPTRAIVHTGRR